MTRQDEVKELVTGAMECSIFLSPTAPGLTQAELVEVGERAGFHAGEIRDAIRCVADFEHAPNLLPHANPMWPDFNFPRSPDYRNIDAFQFVLEQLRDAVRKHGIAAGKLSRSVVVERAAARQLPARDTEAAVTMMVLCEHLVETGGALSFGRGREAYLLPDEQRKQTRDLHRQEPHRRNEGLEKAYPLVEDVIQRRTDGRAKAVEPFGAFAEALDRLGYGPFRLWWMQTAAEMRRSEPQLSPTMVTVLSAALVEGALTFVVKHARKLGLGVFGSKDYEKPPNHWKVEDLIESAARGQESAILDEALKARANTLVRTRQRIHAGRMLVEYPMGVPDLKPEEARDATTTAELVVRRVVEWIDRYPPS